MTNQSPDAAPTALFGSAWSLFTALALVLVGNGLLGSVLGIRAELEGYATTTTGIVLACYYLGFLIGTQYAPYAVTRVGHVRVFAGLASLASVSGLLHAVSMNPVAWIVFRTLMGAALAGLYVVAESWLNASADNDSRGRMLSVYMVVVMGSIGVGQLLLGTADPAGFGLFILAAALMSLSVLPISLSISPVPAYDLPPRLPIIQVWRASPVGLAGVLAAGAANGAAFAMGPVYGTMAGMSVTRISLFMGTMILGAVALQWPIGAWSDRVLRRRSIVAVNFGAAVTAVAVTQFDTSSSWLLPVVFLFGGLTFPVYSLSLSHANDVLEPHQTIAASSVFVMTWGIGSVIGPIGASIVMDGVGPAGLFWMMGIVHLAVAGYVVYRITLREAPQVSDQAPYVPIPARASALVWLLARTVRPRNGARPR